MHDTLHPETDPKETCCSPLLAALRSCIPRKKPRCPSPKEKENAHSLGRILGTGRIKAIAEGLFPTVLFQGRTSDCTTYYTDHSRSLSLGSAWVCVCVRALWPNLKKQTEEANPNTRNMFLFDTLKEPTSSD